MRVLVIGGSGLVGGNLLQCLAKHQIQALGTHYSFATSDTIHYDPLMDIVPESITAFKPNWVVHAGALTHVDYCEQNPTESYNQTVLSTIKALELAKQFGAGFVYISTDYVFDGQHGPYTEEDAPNPLSIYGKHKWDAEQLVRNSGLQHLILRITNVYGDEQRRKNFVARLVDWAKEPAVEGQAYSRTLTLPIDQYATPICAADIALSIHCLIQDHELGTWHLSSTDYMNRVQLAQGVLKYFPDHKLHIEASSTEELAQLAPRPLFGGLNNAKFSQRYPSFPYTTVDSYIRQSLSDPA